jgi:hypothetical protein
LGGGQRLHIEPFLLELSIFNFQVMEVMELYDRERA